MKLHFAEAEPSVLGPSWRGVSGEPTEDPVKNGACLRHVRPRRGLKGRVRRLGSGGARSSLGALCPKTEGLAERSFDVNAPKNQPECFSQLVCNSQSKNTDFQVRNICFHYINKRAKRSTSSNNVVKNQHMFSRQ